MGLQGIKDEASGTQLASYPAAVQFLIELKRINGLFSLLRSRPLPQPLLCMFLP